MIYSGSASSASMGLSTGALAISRKYAEATKCLTSIYGLNSLRLINGVLTAAIFTRSGVFLQLVPRPIAPKPFILRLQRIQSALHLLDSLQRSSVLQKGVSHQCAHKSATCEVDKLNTIESTLQTLPAPLYHADNPTCFVPRMRQLRLRHNVRGVCTRDAVLGEVLQDNLRCKCQQSNHRLHVSF
ncbi:hypothetical protein PAXRUDRAFT_829121 [Paxillus rubicundulus Ve08.2h10]|uniref:Uncharacterized protein n=1 Tax=Paxillus rubicundulus Ve08.2h10 TaxID=930991 RepID=A0A0D0E0H0_9AGAM|nr:hypothetical protein PAXRUDRAFT_829121 [Paxillus rubicundulus Ve08.2h10]